MDTVFQWSSTDLLLVFILIGMALPAIVEYFDDRTQHDLQHDLHDDKMHAQH